MKSCPEGTSKSLRKDPNINEALPMPEKTGRGPGKEACKSVEKEENHKKAHAGRGQEIKWEIPDKTTLP